jgi:tetratricopeptide (TPR) repeat protein
MLLNHKTLTTVLAIIATVWLVESSPLIGFSMEDNTGKHDYLYYTDQADGYFNNWDYLNAIDFYLLAIHAEQQEKYPKPILLANGMSNVGFTYYTLGLSTKALTYFDQAIEIYRQQVDSVEIAINLANKAHCLFYIGEYTDALQCMNEALEIERILGNKEGESINLNAIGKIYEKWNKYDDALFFYHQALEIDQKQNNLNRTAIRLSSIGSAFLQKKMIDSALFYQQKALEIDKELGNMEEIGIRLGRIGEIYQEKKDFKIAEGYFEQALDIFSQFSNESAYASMLLNLARNSKSQNNVDQSIEYFLKCIHFGEKHKLNPLIHKASKEIAEVYELSGKYEKAYFYLYESNKLEEALFSKDNLRIINEFKEKYESEKIENTNKLLQKDLELKEKSERLFIILFILLILLSVSIIMFYKSRAKLMAKNKMLLQSEFNLRHSQLQKIEAENKLLEDRIFAEKQINRLQREKHEFELEFKNTKLANATICLVNKNEILSEVLTELKKHNPNGQLENVIRFIQINTDSNQDWHHFRIEFEKTNPGFFDRLHSTYSNLSEYDVRLCAYLLIGLTTKEIARLMNLSIDAVSKNRQRLRKKMILKPETDLNILLKNI